jgi:hypothetical protein
MQMFEEEDVIVFELNAEETDQLFEPFDGSNKTLSLRDYQYRYRFFKPEVAEWFMRMTGTIPTHKILDYETGSREIWFYEKKHAMAFKMTYG